MRLLKYILIINIILSASCWAQETPSSKFSITIPTVAQEATSIWRTINDIKFFEKNGYVVNLPKDELIEKLIDKSKKGTFNNNDYSAIYNLLESKVYNKTDYKLALKNVQLQEQLINNMIVELHSLQDSCSWNFNMLDNYNVVFTLYGSGGSYDPQNGTVTLFTTKKGDFKNYKNPANTIIHEIVHIAIEESIVQKFELSHSLKELTVDTMVKLLFSNLLPEYKVQNMGNFNIDNYLKNTNDIKNLDKTIKNIKAQNKAV